MAAETSLEFVESWRRKSYEVMDRSSDAMAAVMARSLELMSAVVREPTNEQKLERLLDSLQNEHQLSKKYEQSFDPVRDLMYGTLESMRHVLQHVMATPTQVWSEVKMEEIIRFNMSGLEEEVDQGYRSVEMDMDMRDEMDGVEIVEEKEEPQRKPSIEVINLDDDEEEKEEEEDDVEEMDELSSSEDEVVEVKEEERHGLRRNKRARKDEPKMVDSEEEEEDEEKEEEKVVKKKMGRASSTIRKGRHHYECPICKFNRSTASRLVSHLSTHHGQTPKSLGLLFRCRCGALVRSASHTNKGTKCAGQRLSMVRESETEKKDDRGNKKSK